MLTVDSRVCNIELWWQIQGPDNNGQYRSYQAPPVIASSHYIHQAMVRLSLHWQILARKDNSNIVLKHFVSHNNLHYWLTNDAYPMWNIIIQISSHHQYNFLKATKLPWPQTWIYPLIPQRFTQKAHHGSKFWTSDF